MKNILRDADGFLVACRTRHVVDFLQGLIILLSKSVSSKCLVSDEEIKDVLERGDCESSDQVVSLITVFIDRTTALWRQQRVMIVHTAYL